MREVEATRALVARLNKLPLCHFIVKEAAVTRGHPDVMGCVDGRMLVMEMKKRKPTPSSKGHALQLKRLEEWSEAGALSAVVTGKEDLAEFEKWVGELSQEREFARKQFEKRGAKTTP